MRLFLQFGHGMMDHSRQLIENWGEGTVILSPRDMNESQIDRLSTDILERKGTTLLDPQFYDPRGDHHGLVKHDYWPRDFNTSAFLSGPPLTALLDKLIKINDLAKVDKVILPGLYCERVDDDWLAVQDAIIGEAEHAITHLPRVATICLSAEVLRFEDQIEMLLNASEEWNVSGYYVVQEHPSGSYLADDPMWLTNLLFLCAGLKQQGREVVVGYASHQLLCLACADVDTLAVGSWLNVRSFTTGKFQEPDEDEISRRVKWYYCPQTLSEYKLPFLDMAFRRGVLTQLATGPEYGSRYSDVLFTGAQPSTTDYSELQSFRHYLTCLHHQCMTARKASFSDTVDHHRQMLDSAEACIRATHRAGVRGQNRDFENIIDVNRAAIDAFVEARSFVMERLWQ